MALFIVYLASKLNDCVITGKHICFTSRATYCSFRKDNTNSSDIPAHFIEFRKEAEEMKWGCQAQSGSTAAWLTAAGPPTTPEVPEL